MDLNHSALTEFGLVGLSAPQLWVVVILAQVGVLLWFSRRISSFAGLSQGIPSGAIESEMSQGEWESRIVTHRLKQLKSEPVARLGKLPAVSTERVVGHNGWRTSLRVCREHAADGEMLITVTRVPKNGSREKTGAEFAFVVRPDGSKQDVFR